MSVTVVAVLEVTDAAIDIRGARVRIETSAGHYFANEASQGPDARRYRSKDRRRRLAVFPILHCGLLAPLDLPATVLIFFVEPESPE